MPAALPVPTSVEPSRAANRTAGARPSEAGFSGQLAQALATPSPGSAPAPSAAAPQQASGQDEPTPSPVVPKATDTAPAASVSEPALPVSQPPGDADAEDMAVAAEPGPAEASSDSDEPAAEPMQVQAGDPLPAQQPSAAGETASPAPAALPDNMRSDAAAPQVPTEAAGAGSGQVPSDAAPATALPTGLEKPAGEPAARPAMQRKPQVSGAGVPALTSERTEPLDDRTPSPDLFSPAVSGAQPADAGKAPEPKTDETAAGGRSLTWPVADPGQAALQPAAQSSTPGDAAALSTIQPNAPAQAARPDAAPAGAAPAPPPPPAAQVAPAVAALVSTAPNGTQRLVVRLSPVELGQVEVRVERAEGGPATVALTVERPETLLLLVRDQAGLHRALDQAGVPAEGRTLQFQLGQQDPGAPGQQSDAGAGGGWAGGGARHGRGETNRAWRQFGDGDTQTVRAAWSRAGVDITA